MSVQLRTLWEYVVRFLSGYFSSKTKTCLINLTRNLHFTCFCTNTWQNNAEQLSLTEKNIIIAIWKKYQLCDTIMNNVSCYRGLWWAMARLWQAMSNGSTVTGDEPWLDCDRTWVMARLWQAMRHGSNMTGHETWLDCDRRWGMARLWQSMRHGSTVTGDETWLDYIAVTVDEPWLDCDSRWDVARLYSCDSRWDMARLWQHTVHPIKYIRIWLVNS